MAAIFRLSVVTCKRKSSLPLHSCLFCSYPFIIYSIDNHCLSIGDHDGSRRCEQVFVYAAGSHYHDDLAVRTQQVIDDHFATLPQLLKEFQNTLQQSFHPMIAANGTAENLNMTHDSTPEVDRPVGFSHDVEISPNVLALFLCSVFDPRYALVGPPVNHRSLEAKRIWNQSSIPGPGAEGIVSTLLRCGGLQQEKFDPTLCAMPYFIFPYRVREEAGETSKDDDVPLEFILAHDKDKPTKLCGESIHADDLHKLVALLDEVRTIFHIAMTIFVFNLLNNAAFSHL